MRISRTTGILLLAFFSRVHAADVDPLVWKKPAEAPVFREQVSPEDFKTRVRIVLERLGDLSKLAASTIPEHAVRVVRVLPESQAFDWNLRSDDLITKIDSIELWGGSLPKKDVHRKVTVYRAAENRFQTMKAEPGEVGIQSGLHWRPELTYLRNKSSRNPKWDEHVVVGTHCCQSDPDLAETAWLHAVKAGYRPDGLTWVCGASIAFNQGRTEAACDFAYLAREAEPKRAKVVNPNTLLRIMLANYKFSDAFDLCQEYRDELYGASRVYQLLAELHRGRSERERHADPPSQIVEQFYRNDLMPRCIPLTMNARQDLPKLLEGNGLTVSMSNGFHRPLIFMPSDPARDVELTVRFTPIQMNPGREESFFAVGLVPYSSENLEGELEVRKYLRVGLTFLESSRIALDLGIPVPTTNFDESGDLSISMSSREFRVIRVRGQLEAFVDGKRWLYQPVADEQIRFAAYLDTSAARIKIESIQFAELLQR